MIIYTGETLKKEIEESQSLKYKKRWIYKNLKEYCTESDTKRVFCLYGLRWTGKTTMMLQVIEELKDYEHTLWIQCEKTDTNLDIKRAVRARKEGLRYVFLSEATYVSGFHSNCEYLADELSAGGVKVVISGTDSLGFVFASRDAILDRVDFLHTTYISFAEYNYLLGKELDEYIRFGGTLTDCLENSSVPENMAGLSEYINVAVVENIVNSIECVEEERRYGALVDILESKDLPSCIRKVIELYNRSFVRTVMDRVLSFHTPENLAELSDKHEIDIFPMELGTKKMTELIRKELGLKNRPDTEITEDAVEKIKEYLRKMDVIYPVENINTETEEILFIQPWMRYGLAAQMIRDILNSQTFMQYSTADRERLQTMAEHEILERMLEDINNISPKMSK